MVDRADVANGDDLAALLDRIPRTLAPVGGILHAAGVPMTGSSVDRTPHASPR
jgi:hypothetical protein